MKEWVWGPVVSVVLCTGLQAQAGTVDGEQRISGTAGGFSGVLDDLDNFGDAVGRLADLNGDGRDELAVGAPFDDDGGLNKGAVYVLFLDAVGAVTSSQKISEGSGGFLGTLTSNGEFGAGLDRLDDLDGDGIDDLLVGSPFDGGNGAVWCLFLNANGTVKDEAKIGQGQGGFMGTLDAGDRFGSDVALLGDVDGDAVNDIAVGAFGDDDGGTNRGAVWVLFMNTDGTVKAEQKLSATSGAFGGGLGNFDDLGRSVGGLGDVDGDNVPDLVAGAPGDDDGFPSAGAVYILRLNANGTVKSRQKISSTAGAFGAGLGPFDRFGWSARSVSDLDGDQIGDLCVGAFDDDDGGNNRGAAYVLFLNAGGTVKSKQKISSTSGDLTGPLANDDAFGWSVCSLGDNTGGDIDGDGFPDIVVGAPYVDDGGADRGAVWVLFPEGIDGFPPTLFCPTQVDAECTDPTGATVNFSVTASDVVDPAPSVVCSPPSGSLFPPGTTRVTCTATDASGNMAMCSFDVVVADTTGPVVTCPNDITEGCTSPAGAVVTFSASVSDACDPAPSVVCVPPSGSTFPVGTSVVTCTGTDASGNESVCTFNVTVTDTLAPDISCPSTIMAECNGSGAIVRFTVTATDNCDDNPTVVSTPSSGSLFPLGRTTVMSVATDAAGNESMCSFDVVVVDSTAPAIQCPDDIVTTGISGAVVDFVVTATDACDPAPAISCIPPSGSLFPVGVTRVSCTATDASGNESMCTFDVEVVSPAVPSLGALGVGALAALVSAVGALFLARMKRG